MIYIFDLDYTLFDVKKFNKAIAKILGLSLKKYYESYERDFRSPKINYNIYKHLSILTKEKTITKEKGQVIRNNIAKRFVSLDEFLYPDVENVLRELRSRNCKIVLVSYGDQLWQKYKISRLKIKKYFDKIIITDKQKGNVLDFLKKSKEEKIIINDKATESLEMKKILDKSEIFLIKGPYSKDSQHNLKTYKLNKILKYKNYEN